MKILVAFRLPVCQLGSCNDSFAYFRQTCQHRAKYAASAFTLRSSSIHSHVLGLDRKIDVVNCTPLRLLCSSGYLRLLLLFRSVHAIASSSIEAIACRGYQYLILRQVSRRPLAYAQSTSTSAVLWSLILLTSRAKVALPRFLVNTPKVKCDYDAIVERASLLLSVVNDVLGSPNKKEWLMQD